MHKLYRKKTIARFEKKVQLLGPNYKHSVAELLTIRFLGAILLFVGTFFLFQYGFLLAFLFVLLFYYSFEKVVLDRKIKKRTQKLEKEAIFFFEVLSISLESKSHLLHALELTAKNISGEFSDEFKKVLSEVHMGKSFTESLKSMKERMPSEAIQNLLLNLIDSNLYGSSMLSTLNTEIDYLKEKQIFETKAYISKLPIQISIVSVLFFIPILFLLILSPVLIQFFSR